MEVITGDLQHVFGMLRREFPDLTENQIREAVPVYTTNLNAYVNFLKNTKEIQKIEKGILFMREVLSKEDEPLQKVFEGIEHHQEKHKKGISCFKGCHWCCRLEPNISATEALLLRKHYRKEQPWEEFHAVQDFYCPFVIGKRCSVHKERPLACRIHQVKSDPVYCRKMEGNIDIYFDLDIHILASAFFSSDVLRYGEWGYGKMSSMLKYWSENVSHQSG